MGLVSSDDRAPCAPHTRRAAIYEDRPYPEFSWSVSRARMLEQCPRKYYYRYYLFHNGWLRDAPEASRRAYVLSKLTNLDALFGSEIDVRAREIELEARAGGPLPTAEELEARTRGALNTAWRSSRDRTRFEAHPTWVTMLRSVYLEQDTAPEIERVKLKMAACLGNLLRVSHWQRLAECGAEGCVLIPEYAHCLVGGIKVYAAADLAYVHEEVLHVIDWKSGREDADHAAQVLLSAYCLHQCDPTLSDLQVSGVVEYLADGQRLEVTFPADLERYVRSRLQRDVAVMRRYLLDPAANVPRDAEEFERRESGLCAGCNFTPLCEAAA